jgi:hypothetical protein
MKKLPWEKLVELHEPEPEPEAIREAAADANAMMLDELYAACTHAMQHVRLRVSHAGGYRVVSMRADDPMNPCGEIKLNDGSTIRVETFGVPGPSEPVHTGEEIMELIVKYIRSTGLTIPDPYV